MMFSRLVRTYLSLSAALLVVACSPSPKATESTLAEVKLPLTIYADNYPVAYFTERIAGPLAKVILPVAPDRDPAYWKPKDDDIAKIQQADLIVLNGADYSKWSTLMSLPTSKLVDTSRGFKGRFMYIEDAVVHSHGTEGEHSHAGLSSYTWLDPDQAILQAEAIAKALKSRVPSEAKGIDERFEGLKKDLTAIKDRLQKLASKKSEPLLASHPVYDYLARHAGWNLKSVHWEPDEMPADDGWKELAKLTEKHPARWMIWEGSPLPETVQKLNALGINSVVFDCSPNRPSEGDYLTVMNRNIDELVRVYEYEPDGTTPPSQ